MKHKIEQERITISIGLLAFFITIIIFFLKLSIPFKLFHIFLKWGSIIYLGLICLLFLLYLLLKSLSVKYNGKNILNFESLNNPCFNPNTYKLFFDWGVQVALGALYFIPFALIILFFLYVLGNIFSDYILLIITVIMAIVLLFIFHLFKKGIDKITKNRRFD